MFMNLNYPNPMISWIENKCRSHWPISYYADNIPSQNLDSNIFLKDRQYSEKIWYAPKEYFVKKLTNGEIFRRNWFVNSLSTGKVF